MRWLVHELRLFCIALQFFTRIPVPAWVGWTPEWMHASARHYPAVGLCIGAVGAAVLALFLRATVAWWLVGLAWVVFAPGRGGPRAAASAPDADTASAGMSRSASKWRTSMPPP